MKDATRVQVLDAGKRVLGDASDVLERQGVKVPETGEFLKLKPHVHDTDGFFAAVMERRK